MKKIISLFKRDYKGNRKVYNEIVPGAEWVSEGQGVGTVKFDGTSCMVDNGKLFKRFDRKVSKKKKRREPPFTADDCRPAPEGWIACEAAPNKHTGHWPGWLPVGDGPEDKYHREAFRGDFEPGTYELVGPKIQGNPHLKTAHILIRHGEWKIDAPRDFEGLREFFRNNILEGVVWHHADGRMVKIKRKDFGFDWPQRP